MSRQLGMRTIYGERDLARASQAPGKIADMYESLKAGPESGFVSLLSGASLGEEPPLAPKLIAANPEQTDSGLGDDVVETDHVPAETAVACEEVAELPEESMAPEIRDPPRREKPLPRRPRRTIASAPGTKMRYVQPRQASSGLDSGLGDSSLPSGGVAELASHVSAVPAAQAEAEAQRLHLQNQWHRILFQHHLHYLLPNKDGDT